MEKETGSQMKLMRTASILLALIVVLGFVSEAGAMASESVEHDFSFQLAGQTFGFTDGTLVGSTRSRPYSCLHLGPFGFVNVPFTATQGLVGFCLIVVTFITLLVVLSVRWKRRQSTIADR
jgi:hypothetical protein